MRKVVAKLIIPVSIPFLFILGLYLAYPTDIYSIIGAGMLAGFIPPAGRESVIPLTIIALGSKLHGIYLMDALLVASACILMDMACSLFIVWNFDIAKKIPFLGWVVKRIENKSKIKIAKSAWISKFAFFGLVVFVMIPFQGSGGITSAIMGKLLGMNGLKVFLAVIIGSAVGSLVIAMGTFYLGY